MKLPRRDFHSGGASAKPQGIRIEKPSMEHYEDEGLWREVRKFAELIPSEPDPNFGRVREIKDELKKGTYFTPEVLEETAARLAIRFMTRE